MRVNKTHKTLKSKQNRNIDTLMNEYEGKVQEQIEVETEGKIKQTIVAILAELLKKM